MAFVGKWGTFFHIPKTGGSWVRFGLRAAYGHGEECGPTHSWAHPYIKKQHRTNPIVPRSPFFTFIRHPATWLRSFYHHSGTAKWNHEDQGYGHWGMLCWLTEEFRDDDWEQFAWNICTHRTGLVTWFFHSYMFPGIQVGRLEDFPMSLEKITGVFNEREPANTQSDLPEISPALWNMIEIAEVSIIEQYYTTYQENKYFWKNFEYPSHSGRKQAYLRGEDGSD